MIALLVASALAASSLDDRLLGEVAPASPAEIMATREVPPWVLPLGTLVLAGGGALLWRARSSAPVGTTLRVVAQASIGNGSGIVLVEVAGRKLVIGTGGGAPSLLSEIVDESWSAEPVPSPPSARLVRASRLIDEALAQRTTGEAK
jgi:hypothetical protein